MVLNASPSARSHLEAARFVVLALAALLIAHTAVFLVQYGAGAGFASAMEVSGHDGYWLGWMGFVLSAAGVVGILTAIQVTRSRRHRPSIRDVRAEATVPTYVAELFSLWPRLFGAVVLGFLIQENVEHLASGGHLLGLWALAGPEYPLAIPALLGVTLGLAALGAFVRWRVAVLLARRPSRHGPASLDRPPRSSRPTPGWAVSAALCLHRWILARQLSGRAPPAASIA